MKKKFSKALAIAGAGIILFSISAGGNSVSAAQTWQSAYSSFLKNEMKTDSDSQKAFDVYDLDGNGTPELIFSESDNKFAGTAIYTFDNNELIKVGTNIKGYDYEKQEYEYFPAGNRDDGDFYSCYGYIGFSPETGEIVNYSTGTGVGYSYFKLEKSTLVHQFDSSFGGRTLDVPPGTWKGKDVSESEYFNTTIHNLRNYKLCFLL